MIIHAHGLGLDCPNWRVWDVKRCCVVRNVVWADDETARWGELTGQIDFARQIAEERIHQEQRITIYADRKLILFNEVEDEGREDEQELALIGCDRAEGPR